MTCSTRDIFECQVCIYSTFMLELVLVKHQTLAFWVGEFIYIANWSLGGTVQQEDNVGNLCSDTEKLACSANRTKSSIFTSQNILYCFPETFKDINSFSCLPAYNMTHRNLRPFWTIAFWRIFEATFSSVLLHLPFHLPFVCVCVYMLMCVHMCMHVSYRPK